MKRGIDYREYDPEQFAFDHSDDPVLLHARENAQILHSSLSQASLEGEPHERRQHVDQGFDMLQNALWDRLDLVIKNEHHRALEEYRDDRRDEITLHGQAAVSRAGDRDGEVAAWEGTPQELSRVGKITTAEARAESPEFNEKIAQLEGYQSVRNEAASNEIERYRYQTLRERGLHEVQPPERGRETTAPDAHPGNERNIPTDVMAKAGEATDPNAARLARLQEAHRLAGTPADQEDGRDRKPGHER
ncbi:MAG: hypothetical protein ACO1SV_15265 [Fimbriimonas sp.]